MSKRLSEWSKQITNPTHPRDRLEHHAKLTRPERIFIDEVNTALHIAPDLTLQFPIQPVDEALPVRPRMRGLGLAILQNSPAQDHSKNTQLPETVLPPSSIELLTRRAAPMVNSLTSKQEIYEMPANLRLPLVPRPSMGSLRRLLRAEEDPGAAHGISQTDKEAVIAPVSAGMKFDTALRALKAVDGSSIDPKSREISSQKEKKQLRFDDALGASSTKEARRSDYPTASVEQRDNDCQTTAQPPHLRSNSRTSDCSEPWKRENDFCPVCDNQGYESVIRCGSSMEDMSKLSLPRALRIGVGGIYGNSSATVSMPAIYERVESHLACETNLSSSRPITSSPKSTSSLEATSPTSPVSPVTATTPLRTGYESIRSSGYTLPTSTFSRMPFLHDEDPFAATDEFRSSTLSPRHSKLHKVEDTPLLIVKPKSLLQPWKGGRNRPKVEDSASGPAEHDTHHYRTSAFRKFSKYLKRSETVDGQEAIEKVERRPKLQKKRRVVTMPDVLVDSTAPATSQSQ